jgi:hypothetical protein
MEFANTSLSFFFDRNAKSLLSCQYTRKIAGVMISHSWGENLKVTVEGGNYIVSALHCSLHQEDSYTGARYYSTNLPSFQLLRIRIAWTRLALQAAA